MTPSEPDKSPPLPAFFLFQSPLHLLSSRLICHYRFLSHSLSSPFCCCLSFHSHCVPVCQSLSRLYSRLLRLSVLLGLDSSPLRSLVRSLHRDQSVAFSISIFGFQKFNIRHNHVLYVELHALSLEHTFASAGLLTCTGKV